MGWLSMQSLGGHAGPREYLDNQFAHEDDQLRSRVLRSSICRRVYYAAVEHVRPPDGEREVWACVCLTRYNPNARDGYIFGYKDMEESMGPYYYDCPAVILDLLTPTDNENSLSWRAKCREAAAQRRTVAAKPKPRPGQVIVFEPPVEFAGGAMFERMEVVAHPWRKRSILFRAPGRPGLYHIPGVNKLAYRLEAPLSTS
jgi:hypothetical protein